MSCVYITYQERVDETRLREDGGKNRWGGYRIILDHMQTCMKQWYNGRWNGVLVAGSWSHVWLCIEGEMVRCCNVRVITPMLGFSISLFMSDPGCKVRIGMLLNLTVRTRCSFYIVTVKLSEDGSPVALSNVEQVQYFDRRRFFTRADRWFRAREGKEIYKNYPDGMVESSVDLSTVEPVDGLYPFLCISLEWWVR
jgi:hypothetical protein